MEQSQISPLLEEENKILNETPNYTEDQRLYLRNLQKRLEYAKIQRDQPREEFDGMTYEQYWMANEAGANTYIKPKKDKNEINFQSGMLKQKLWSLVSSLQSLNLGADVLAFDQNDTVISALGQSMEDIIEKTEEMENDEEKRMLRQYEMLKQGDVFIEEIWNDVESIQKVETAEFNGKFTHKYWRQTVKKDEGKPERRIVSGLKVFLGDITQYFLQYQPFIFTRASVSYKELERIYGSWEMWKYVPKQQRSFTGENNEDALVSANWNLQLNPDGKCEIIKYQDAPNDEYQIIINAIPMCPIGAPLPWGRYYNIEQQHSEPIRENFAYGKSYVFRNKNNVYLIDEIIKMMLLKTWKSLIPPRFNLSGRVVPASVFMPSKMTMGLKPQDFPLAESDVPQGVNASEFSMLQEVIRFVDANTTSQTFGGMQEKGATTATQIVEVQRQARIMLGVVILAASLLEKKITQLRLKNLIKHWFDPVDTVVDDARQQLKNRYRIISRQRQIGEEGNGLRYTMLTEEPITQVGVKAQEESMKEELGVPVRITAINPQEVRQGDYIWFVSVNPKEKKSSEMSKLMFGEMVAQATQLGLQLNPQVIQEDFAAVWDRDPSKLFLQAGPATPPAGTPAGGAPITPQNKPLGVQQPSINQLTKETDNANLV